MRRTVDDEKALGRKSRVTAWFDVNNGKHTHTSKAGALINYEEGEDNIREEAPVALTTRRRFQSRVSHTT